MVSYPVLCTMRLDSNESRICETGVGSGNVYLQWTFLINKCACETHVGI